MLCVLCALCAQHGGCIRGSRRPEPAWPYAIHPNRPAPFNQLSRAHPSFFSFFLCLLTARSLTIVRSNGALSLQRRAPKSFPCCFLVQALLGYS